MAEWHFIKEWVAGQSQRLTLCGIDANKLPKGKKFMASNYIGLVTCKKCIERWYRIYGRNNKKTLCSFCSTPLAPEDYNNPNDFFLSCFQHKQLAQIETERFFKLNPDYTKWGFKK